MNRILIFFLLTITNIPFVDCFDVNVLAIGFSSGCLFASIALEVMRKK